MLQYKNGRQLCDQKWLLPSSLATRLFQGWKKSELKIGEVISELCPSLCSWLGVSPMILVWLSSWQLHDLEICKAVVRQLRPKMSPNDFLSQSESALWLWHPWQIFLWACWSAWMFWSRPEEVSWELFWGRNLVYAQTVAMCWKSQQKSVTVHILAGTCLLKTSVLLACKNLFWIMRDSLTTLHTQVKTSSQRSMVTKQESHTCLMGTLYTPYTGRLTDQHPSKADKGSTNIET